jgi:hypothetical protein
MELAPGIRCLPRRHLGRREHDLMRTIFAVLVERLVG